jgi:hypothetical protein
MKKHLLAVFLMAFLATLPVQARDFRNYSGATNLRVDYFFNTGYAPASVETSATTSATITFTATDIVVDTHQDVAVSTVNTLAGGIEGDNFSVKTLTSARDVAFVEGGNIFLGAAARTLSTPLDIIEFKVVASGNSTYYVETGFVNNL